MPPETSTHPRHLAWDACLNARDLGGLATTSGAQVRRGALIRSDYTGRLTSAGQAALRAHGVRTVIDLRTPDELDIDPPAFRDDADVRYLHLPLFLNNETFDAALSATNSSIEAYRLFIDHWSETIAGIVTTIAHAPEGGVLVHCYSGKDRTGLMVALVLATLGVPDEAIAADYALTDDNLRHWYAEVLARTDDPVQRERLEKQIFTAFPATMLATLAYLRERYGGAESYLLQAGVSPAEIELLRARLLH